MMRTPEFDAASRCTDRRTRLMRRLNVAAAALLISLAALAAPTSAPVRSEIDALLGRLQSSGCTFNRNGTWYNSDEAKDHLLRKLEYIERRGTVASTEQFIELAATKSSSSGQSYQVKCGAVAAVPSAQWLGQQLKQIRATGAQAK